METSPMQQVDRSPAIDWAALLPIAQVLADFLAAAMAAAPVSAELHSAARVASSVPAEVRARVVASRAKSSSGNGHDRAAPGPLIGDAEYGVDDAARFLRVATVTVRKMISSERIKSHLNERGRRVIYGADLSQVIARSATAVAGNGAAAAA